MSLNALETLISESNDSPESNKIYDIVENFPKYEKCQIQLSSFEKFCKIPFKIESIGLIYCFGKVLETLLFYKLLDIETFTPNSLIDLMNCLVYVLDKTSGTNLSKILMTYIEEYINILLKKDEISEDEKIAMKQLNQDLGLKKYSILDSFEESSDVEEILFYVKSKHIEDKICGTQKLIQFMNSSKGFEEQLELLGKKLPNIIKCIIQDCYQKDERKTKELLIEMGKLTTTIIGDYEFFLKINREVFLNYNERNQLQNEVTQNLYIFIEGKEEIEEKSLNKLNNVKFNEAIVHYKIINYEDTMRNHENIYSSIALIINTFLLYPNYLELQEISFKVLSKLYIIFPKFRKNLEEPILTVLTRISENEASDVKKDISIFLFKIAHKYGPQDFTNLLTNKPNFKQFYDSSYYNEKVFKSYENTLEAISPLQLIIKTVFPIEKKVEAGKTFQHIFEVFHPFSIIYIGFATQYYDISFRLKLITLFSEIKNLDNKEEETTIYYKENINATKNPCRVVYLAKKPGLYKIEFDNEYSWVNEKCIRYKLLVLQPQNLEFFLTGEGLGSIVEEVKSYESLDIEQQQNKTRKLSSNLNKMSLEKNEIINENQVEKLRSLVNNEKDNQDIQMILSITLDNLHVIVKSMKLESEWTIANTGNFDLSKFYMKVDDFFKRKRSIEANETKFNEKQTISIFCVYNQDALEGFLRRNLKNYNLNASLKQIFIEIFDFEKKLPKYFEWIYYHFIRDVNLFFHSNYSNSLAVKLNKKDIILMIYMSQGSKEQNTPESAFFQSFILDNSNSSNLFLNSLNFAEDLTKISYKNNGSLKSNFLNEIYENKNGNEGIGGKITQMLEYLIYNVYIIYDKKVKSVVFWEPDNKLLQEGCFREKEFLELKELIKIRLDKKIGLLEEIWFFDEKALKKLKEI